MQVKFSFHRSSIALTFSHLFLLSLCCLLPTFTCFYFLSTLIDPLQSLFSCWGIFLNNFFFPHFSHNFLLPFSHSFQLWMLVSICKLLEPNINNLCNVLWAWQDMIVVATIVWFILISCKYIILFFSFTPLSFFIGPMSKTYNLSYVTLKI